MSLDLRSRAAGWTRWCTVAALLPATLLSCGPDEAGFAPSSEDPPSVDELEDFEGQSAFTFLVYRTGAYGVERLRWKGTHAGPAEDSPESTRHPYVGRGQSFRIAWRVVAQEDRVYGQQFKPTDEFVNWATATGNMDSPVRSFQFENAVAQEDLSIYGCGEDLDCVGQLYLENTEFLFQVAAMDALGRTLAVEEGRLNIRVGFPPPLFRVPDGMQYWKADGDGPFAFASGDTVPLGAMVVVRSRIGRHDAVDPDPDWLCCNQDPAGWSAAVVKSRLRFGSDSDSHLPVNEMVSESDSTSSTVTFRVGPYDYELESKGADRRGGWSLPGLSLRLHGGYPPSMAGVEPTNGTQIVLRDPSGGDPWPENEVAYEVSGPVTLYWDGTDFVEDLPGAGAEDWVTGHWFYLPLRLEGRGSLRDLSSSARAFAFRWYAAPSSNTVRDSPLESLGTARADYHEASGENVLELTGDDRIRIFVPALIWIFPDLFLAGTNSPSHRAMGIRLEQSLGDVTIEATCRTTAPGDRIVTFRDLEDTTSPLSAFYTGPYGDVSSVARESISVRLGIDPFDEAGSIQLYFPPLGGR